MKFVLVLVILSVCIWAALQFRKIKQKLEEKDREIDALERRGSEFVANVSHELKTPLTSIKGFAETLRAGALRDPQRAVEFLTRIEENAERLSMLVNDILDLAKIESPNMYLECEKFDPSRVIAEIKKDFDYPLSQRRQDLKVKAAVNEVYADRRLFDQAIRNLVVNAHRYCPEGAQIEIQSSSVSEQGRHYVKFVVSDNGPGISPHDLPRIFERFYRADKSRNRLSGGTGLGLAIVKHIMLSHGGFVRAASEPLKGAAFSMFFPLESGTHTQS